MMKRKIETFCIVVLLITGSNLVSIRSHAGCELLATTHAENIDALTALLPADTRGVLAVDFDALLSGSAADAVTSLLQGDGSDAALVEPFRGIGALAGNVDLSGVVKTALLAQTTEASDGLFLLAQVSCDTIDEVTSGPALVLAGTHGTGIHALYRDLNGNSLALLTGGVLIVGSLQAVQSILDVADGVAPSRACAIAPFFPALQSGSSFSFVYGLPALFNSAISPDRSLRGAALVSGALDFAGTDISGSVSFHTSNAAAFVDNYNELDSASGDAPLILDAPIAGGLSQVGVTIPPTPIDKSADDLIASRNILKKLFPNMQAFDYAEDVADPGNKPWLDIIISSEADGDGSPGSVFIRWEFTDQAAIDAFEANELPAGFHVAPTRFLESDEHGYFLVLNLYNAAGPIVSGARAEWDIFVQPPNGDTRPRFMVIDALAAAVSADSVRGLTPAEPVSHQFSGNDVVTRVGMIQEGVATTVFTARFPRPDPAADTIARFTREMAAGNDYIYWGNGVLDRGCYNATTFNYDAVLADMAQVDITDNSPWKQYLQAEPTYVVYYLNTLEYVVSPWYNLDSPWLDISPEWLEELYDFKNNGNYLTLMKDAVRSSFQGTGDVLTRFDITNMDPATYYNFKITDPAGLSETLTLPTGYSLAPIRFFERDAAQEYYLTLVLYEIDGAIEGRRAEWRVYVDDGSGRARCMIIDLQTEDAALDPVSMINLPSTVVHDLAGGRVTTSLSSSSIDFAASFNTAGATDAVLSLGWIEADDYLCHINGICDKRYYDGETLDEPVHVPAAVTIQRVATPWDAFIDTTPAVVFFRDNAQEYVVKPWQNVNVVVEEPEPPEIGAGTHFITGTGTLTGESNAALDSSYAYTGAATISGPDLDFTIDQEIQNALGTSHIITTGSFDVTTGLGTSTVVHCTGAVLLCAGVDPVIGTPDATSDYTASNLNASDTDCISWEVAFPLTVPGFGEAYSHSSFTAVLAEKCSDRDGDGYFVEGGCCGQADCDDSDAEVHAGAAEICDDGIDNDCDGLVDYEDDTCCRDFDCCPLTITPSRVSSGSLPRVAVLRVTGDTANGFSSRDPVTTAAVPGLRILFQFSRGDTRVLVVVIDDAAAESTAYLFSGSVCMGQLFIE